MGDGSEVDLQGLFGEVDEVASLVLELRLLRDHRPALLPLVGVVGEVPTRLPLRTFEAHDCRLAMLNQPVGLLRLLHLVHLVHHHHVIATLPPTSSMRSGDPVHVLKRAQSKGDGVLVLVQVVNGTDAKVVLFLSELHIPRRLLVSPREIVQDQSYKQISIKAKRQKRRFIFIADP